MPRITHMYMRKGKPERFVVTIDDDQEIIFTPETILKYVLASDKEFSDREFLQILEEDSVRQAKDQAMRYLAIRPHSRLELVKKMRTKGYRYEVINRALDELEKLDLVNDSEFARLFIQNELKLRPVARVMLQQKLAARGIDREIYLPLLQEMYSEEMELKLVRELTQKFLQSPSRQADRKVKEKLVRHLQNKGFQWDHIQQALEEFFGSR
ncbi:MAG: hypothetical protein Kow0042_11710 [Calditrichia bacterium]